MSDTFNLSKSELVTKEKQRMAKELVGGNWTIREKVALTCRILFDKGHDSGLSGQITTIEKPGVFITQQLGMGFDEITPSNLLKVDEHLNVISGKGMPNPANRFHSWIYRAHPEARCIIHTHPIYTSALSMLEEPLKVSHMDACALFDDVAFLPDWPGIPVGNDEGEIISACIGDKRALLLAHHGLVVVGKTIEEACVIAVQFERAARLHMIAAAAGKIADIPEELGKEAHDWVSTDSRNSATFAYFARQVLRREPGCLLP
ncbi:MAG: L-fuculose-phosphate aldolase [Phenylobacterium sp.]|jgi:L-fuculose-phosphate aldolase